VRIRRIAAIGALWGLAGLCAAVAVAAAAAAPAKKPPAEAAEPAPPTHLDLAKADRFYLVLDPARGTLTLAYHNAILREYAVESIEVGSRSVLFVDAGIPEGWERHAWEGGRLDPAKEEERRELHVTSEGVAVKGKTADPSESPEAPEPPPEPPRQFRLRFAGGLTLEFTSARPAGVVARAASWMGGAARALIGSREDRIRLRLRLPGPDAAALYRSLPPEPGFVLAEAGP